MKIGIASDIHLEFGGFTDIPDMDVLVLAGDIFLADDIGGWKNSRIAEFAEATTHIKHVLFIPGNHEFYHQEYFTAIDLMKGFCEDEGWTYLDNEEITIEEQHFIGATLWTDPQESNAWRRMSDYSVIKYEDRVLLPEDTEEFHAESVRFLNENVRPGSVVLTHHLPTFKSIDEKFKYAGHGVNNYYASNLEWVIKKNQPSVWIHGHSHAPKDYMLEKTRIISNPRGYWGYEEIADNYEVKVIEV